MSIHVLKLVVPYLDRSDMIRCRRVCNRIKEFIDGRWPSPFKTVDLCNGEIDFMIDQCYLGIEDANVFSSLNTYWVINEIKPDDVLICPFSLTVQEWYFVTEAAESYDPTYYAFGKLENSYYIYMKDFNGSGYDLDGYVSITFARNPNSIINFAMAPRQRKEFLSLQV